MHKKQHGFTLLELMTVLVLVGLLASIAYPIYSGFVDRARRTKVMGDMGQIQIALAKFLTDTNGALPVSLAAIGLDTLTDPWGNPYQYLKIENAGGGLGNARKNLGMVPVNSDYDLFSMGKDGAFESPLSSVSSRDDIVRAGNGGYMGLAKDFE